MKKFKCFQGRAKRYKEIMYWRRFRDEAAAQTDYQKVHRLIVDMPGFEMLHVILEPVLRIKIILSDVSLTSIGGPGKLSAYKGLAKEIYLFMIDKICKKL